MFSSKSPSPSSPPTHGSFSSSQKIMALCMLFSASSGLSLPTKALPPQPAVPTRRSVLAGSGAMLAWSAFGSPALAEDLGGGLTYSVTKSGKGGGKPVVGDLIVIRFKSVVKQTGQVCSSCIFITSFFASGSAGDSPLLRAASELPLVLCPRR